MTPGPWLASSPSTLLFTSTTSVYVLCTYLHHYMTSVPLCVYADISCTLSCHSTVLVEQHFFCICCTPFVVYLEKCILFTYLQVGNSQPQMMVVSDVDGELKKINMRRSAIHAEFNTYMYGLVSLSQMCSYHHQTHC